MSFSPPKPICKICQISPPKYRCPRCQIRTCSLPCTKRHKIWYSCSGQRDPAAYKTKDELATPAGIDQDYNFLYGLERVLAKAEESFDAAVGDTGSKARASWSKQKRNGPIKGELALEKALHKSGVRIERAPAGIARARENGTSLSNRHILQWTVEWIMNDGTRFLGIHSEKEAIEVAYNTASKKSQRTEQGTNRKRKRELSKKEAASKMEYREKTKDKPVSQAADRPATDSDVTRPSGEQQEPKNETSDPVPSLLPKSAPSPDPPEHTPRSLKPPPPESSPVPTSTSPLLQFYIHTPHPIHPAPIPTISPLLPTRTLADALQGRTVLEFPRIYVFRHEAGELPKGFLIEEGIGDGVQAEKEGEKEVETRKDSVEQEAIGTEKEVNELGAVTKSEGGEREVIFKKEEEGGGGGGGNLLEVLRLRALRSMVK